ncbi:TetR/AcrR family transcriptional regulator [Nocardia sp. NPDC050713]|uniref:TetR/AcrR family transcriptional regulator n=1 Tax=Nocardia sp. NPDC050713 TaxID=3154511 RepID=UPI00340CB283
MIDRKRTSSPRPMRADAARNRRRILEAADELLAQYGEHVTLDDVAKAAGVGVGTAYRHFGNKHALITEILEQYLGWIGEIAESAAQRRDPWCGLVQMLEQTCELVAGNRAFMAAMTGSREGAAVFERHEAMISRPLGEIIERARVDKLVRPEIAIGDIFGVISMVHGVAVFTQPVDPDHWRRYLNLLLNGIRSDRGRGLPLQPPALSVEQIRQARKIAAASRRR